MRPWSGKKTKSLALRFFAVAIGLGGVPDHGQAWMAKRLQKAKSGDPCQAPSPAIGTICSSGTVWVGVMPIASSDGKKYMIMPGGCDGTTNNPTCSGPDTASIKKTWNDGTTNWDSVSGVEAGFLPSTVLGDVNTNALVAATVPVSGGAYAAAKYCKDMYFGGYHDWYLPSGSELAYIYCKADVAGGAHDASKPQEAPNCVAYGGKQSLLPGFVSDLYWQSTQFSSNYAWYQYFGTGDQGLAMGGTKDNSNRVRCVRRF